MARVSTRIGWGRSSAGALAIAGFNGVLAVALFLADHRVAALLPLTFALASTCSAFVHPYKVLELDSDDDPQRKVGDLAGD